jgi:hypothetical protein
MAAQNSARLRVDTRFVLNKALHTFHRRSSVARSSLTIIGDRHVCFAGFPENELGRVAA